jgi:hypothetical protein
VSARSRRAPILAALALTALAACGSEAGAPQAESPAVVRAPSGPRLAFSYETLDGKELSPASLAGRISVIGFVTTYDLPSQAQARFLAGLLRTHTPRINVALLVLEAPENRPMIEAFVASMRLPYPVAIADAETIAGRGPFAGLHHVPSVVILDREGREALRRLGLTTQAELDELLRSVEAPPPAAPR